MGQKDQKSSKMKELDEPSSSNKTNTNKQKADDPSLWPDLPPQLVRFIGREPTLFADICYKGVTKSSFRSESRKCISSPSHIPMSLDLLRDDHDDQQLHTLNITFKGMDFFRWRWNGRKNDDDIYSLGSSHGYQVTKKQLRNPVTRLQLNLPEWDERIPFLFAFLSSPIFLNSKGVCLVLALTGISHPAFFFYKIPARGLAAYAWKKEDCPIVDPHCSNTSDQDRFMRFTNAIGFKGKFYALSLQGTLAVIELIDGSLKITSLGKKRAIPSAPSKHFRECLVESNGEILLVFLIYKKSINTNVDDVEVYRLDIDKLLWIEVESLGDRTLFVGSNCCLSAPASKIGCLRNCVYFNHHSADHGWRVYDLDKGAISPCWSDSSPSDKSPTWAEPL